MAKSVKRLTLTREARVRLPAVAVFVVVLSKPLGRWIMNKISLVSAEGSALSAVKPWSSFQCTGIHHAVRALTYEGSKHLAYALNKSMDPLPFFKKTVSYRNIDGIVEGGVELKSGVDPGLTEVQVEIELLRTTKQAEIN